jgi:ATP-dependent Clp protease ATP-binding subunit ClpA
LPKKGEVIDMLFLNEIFAPESLQDLRAQTVLTCVARQAPEPIRPSDLLAAVLTHGGEEARGTLTQALRPGNTLAALEIALQRVPHTTADIGPRRRGSFSPQALKALDAFAAALQVGGGLPVNTGLEVLAACALAHLDSQERQQLPALDVELAAAMFIGRAVGALALGALGSLAFDGLPPSVSVEARSEAQGHAPEATMVPPELLPAEDLTARAQATQSTGPYPFDGEPVYEHLFDSVARALHRSQGGHVLLTGERGVGKSTLVAELARRAASGTLPTLAGRRFLAVDGRYVPADESRARLAALLAQVAGRPDLVVCLDGLPALLRGERGSNKPVLLAGLARARCRLVALVTPHEYEELAGDDPEFTELFTRVDVEEPAAEVALKLLGHFAAALEQRYGVAIDGQAVRQAVILSSTYILNDQLPAKALKLLHHSCEDVDYERSQGGASRARVSAEDMVRAVSQASGVPAETLLGVAERADYEAALREAVFGQDHAVQAVATELGLIKAGMTDPDKPASVLLFLGQTGTGKTELAKALARLYSTSKRLKVYTLGNCVEPHSVSTIVGVPPGYVGHDQGGRLINELNTDPYCVFLLDEADKAHPDVLQPFLNLFDEGWVCDQRGVRAHAHKSIFILTTNVGQRMIAELIEQGRSAEEIHERMKEALSQIRHSKSDRPVFTPEFLARIKRVIVFNGLTKKAMASIARKLVAEVQSGWRHKRGKELEIPEALVEHLATQSHRLNERSKGKEGGRIVRKLFREWVEAALQRAIAQCPDDYRTSAAVAVDFVPPPEINPDAHGAHVPGVTVRFGVAQEAVETPAGCVVLKSGN